MTDDNDIIIKAWNTVLFDKFTRFRHLLIDGLSAHSEEAFRRHSPPDGGRVLDIGCGFGDSTIRMARRLAPAGAAVGIDCASNFIAAAEREAKAADVKNARFVVADVQRDALGGPYDFAFSRFGTMFFSLPGAALRNIRRALRPDAELVQVVWRKREDNPWLYAAEQRVREIVPVVSHDETDEVHCGPGPFSMAGADMVSTMMQGVGYDRVTFERFDADICIGRDLPEAIEFAMALGPAGEIIRLAGAEGERLRPIVAKALEDTMAAFARGDGVWAPSSTWFITARNPD